MFGVLSQRKGGYSCSKRRFCCTARAIGLNPFQRLSVIARGFAAASRTGPFRQAYLASVRRHRRAAWNCWHPTDVLAPCGNGERGGDQEPRTKDQGLRTTVLTALRHRRKARKRLPPRFRPHPSQLNQFFTLLCRFAGISKNTVNQELHHMPMRHFISPLREVVDPVQRRQPHGAGSGLLDCYPHERAPLQVARSARRSLTTSRKSSTVINGLVRWIMRWQLEQRMAKSSRHGHTGPSSADTGRRW